MNDMILNSRRMVRVAWAFLLLTACASPSRDLRVSSQESEPFRIASVQYIIEGDRTAAQVVEKFERLALEAIRGGARLVVFPELMVLDSWPLRKDVTEREVVQRIVDDLTPAIERKAEEISARHRVSILAGSMPRQVDQRIHNSAFLVLPGGRKIRQDKMFLTPWEKKQGWAAGRSVQVFDSPWGRSAILICFDSEIPVVSHTLAEDRPEVLLVPSMTESEAGLHRVRWTSQARAIEHYAYVVISGTVGMPAPGWTHHGQGVVIGPWENEFTGVLSEGRKDSPGIVFAELNLPRLREGRKKSGYYPAQEQKGREIRIFRDQ